MFSTAPWPRPEHTGAPRRLPPVAAQRWEPGNVAGALGEEAGTLLLCCLRVAHLRGCVVLF